MKYIRISLMLILLVAIHTAFGQDEENPEKKGFDKSKLFFGGSLGLSFGSYTFINVSPQIGYRFNRTFAAGTGINLQYSSYKTDYNDPSFDYKEQYGMAGLNIFGRIYPIDFILLQLQPELNYTWGSLSFYDGTPERKLDNEFVPSLLGGVGAGIPAGRGAFIVMAQYDILQQERSPYGSSIFFQFGYNVGF